MRNKRIKKFQDQNRPLMITLKLMTIGYLLVFSVSYLATHTVAHFDGQKQVSEILITSGTWEDEESEERVTEDEDDIDDSPLAFIDESYEKVHTCPALLEVEIVNDGENMMEEDGFYEVYYAETGNPKQDGEKINLNEGEGVIEALQPIETAKLTYQTNKQGVYMFVVYANEDVHAEDAIWSEEIIVDCPENETDETDEESETPKNEESKDQDEQSENKQADNDEQETDQEQSNEETEKTEDPSEDQTKDDNSKEVEEDTNETTNNDQEPENNEETENNEMDK